MTGDWGRQHNEQHCDLYCSPNCDLYRSPNVIICTAHQMLLSVLLTKCYYLYCSPNAIICTAHQMLLSVLLTKCYFLYCSPNIIICTAHQMLLSVLLTKCYYLYRSPNIIICTAHQILLSVLLNKYKAGDQIKMSEWTGNVACVRQGRGACTVLVRNPEGKNHLEDPSVDGRWRAIVNAEMNLRVP